MAEQQMQKDCVTDETGQQFLTTCLEQQETLRNDYLALADEYRKMREEHHQITTSLSWHLVKLFYYAGKKTREKLTGSNAGRLLYKTLDTLKSRGIHATARMVKYKLHVLKYGEYAPLPGYSNIHFSEQPVLDALDGTVAVHVHLYYVDLLEEFCSYLDHIPYPFDLFVSVRSQADIEQVKQRMQRIHCVSNVTVECSVNRGRDIAPFYVQFWDRLSQYDYLLHIHSKKSLFTGSEQYGWRQYSLDTLLGSEERIKRIFYQMQHENVGLFFPEVYEGLDYIVNTWMQNEILGRKLSESLHIPFENGFFNYPVGSFFWVQTECLRPLIENKLQLNDFSEEAGQIDGTLAHALERLIAPMTLKSGKQLGIYDILTDELCYNKSLRSFSDYFSMNRQKIQEKLSEYKVIGFNVFGCLVTEAVSEKSILQIIDNKLRENHISGFFENRIQAEMKLQAIKKEYYTLEDIYALLQKWMQLSSTEVCRMMKLEREIRECLYLPREDIHRIFDYLKEQNKKIVLICDSCLPSEMIAEILKNCGYSGWDALWVSCEQCVSKNDGSVWKRLSSQQDSMQWAYCGDDIWKNLMLLDAERVDSIPIMEPDMARKLFCADRTEFLKCDKENAAEWETLLNGWLFNSPFSMCFDGKLQMNPEIIESRIPDDTESKLQEYVEKGYTTLTASSNSSTSHPISSSFAIVASRCFGITFNTVTSPFVAAAANMNVPASIWSGITEYSVL